MNTDTFTITLSENKSAAKITTNHTTLIEVFSPDLPGMLVKSLDDLIDELNQLKSEVLENWEELE